MSFMEWTPEAGRAKVQDRRLRAGSGGGGVVVVFQLILIPTLRNDSISVWVDDIVLRVFTWEGNAQDEKRGREKYRGGNCRRTR